MYIEYQKKPHTFVYVCVCVCVGGGVYISSVNLNVIW